MTTMNSAKVDERIPLDVHERLELLRIARVSVKEWLRSGRLPPGAPHRKSLLAHAGAHVTVRLDGGERTQVRLSPEKPLYLTVAEMAIGAATRPPPVTFADVPRMRFEIAVIIEQALLGATPRHEQIEIGRHGVVLSHQGALHLHLPRVAVDRGWDAPRLLGETCRAAGLPEEAWRDGTLALSLFTADVFTDA